MFSRSNHHHERQQSSSPPPTLGTRRRRSPESVPLEDEGEDTLNKTSPQSGRTTKRGRITSPQRIGPVSLTPQFALDRPSNESQTAELNNSTLPSVAPVVAEQTKHLEMLLDSVLATLVIIQVASTMPIALSKHTREALTVLNKFANTGVSTSAPLVNPPAATSHPRKSYANATTSRPPTQKKAHTARPSPAGQPSRHTTPAKDNRSPRCSPSSSRLIVSWEGNPLPQTPMSLRPFTDYLNAELAPASRPPYSKVVAANVTKSGNLVIHTQNLAVAAELKALPKLVHQCSTAIPDFVRPPGLPVIDADIPWHGIVIHDLPAETLRDAFDTTETYRDIWTLLESEGGVAPKDIRGNLKVLCRDGEESEKERLSMLVRFEDQRIGNSLRRNGIILFGSWYRVSRYRGPKKSSPRPT